MKMAAGDLFRRAAGIENGGAFFDGNAGQFKLLERSRWHGGNLRPMFNDLRRDLTSLANFTVGGVMLELEREQFQCQLGELPVADCRLLIGNQLAQARGEAGKLVVHAVFVCRLVFRDSRAKSYQPSGLRQGEINVSKLGLVSHS